MMYDIFDGHCDTLYELIGNRNEENIIKNKLHFNLYNTNGYNKYIQVTALWANPAHKGCDGKIFMDSLVKKAVKHLEDYNVSIVKSKKDLEKTDRYSVILGIEGADAIEKEEEIEYYFNKGVRCVTLTWNGVNAIGSGALSDSDEGLSHFGKKAVQRLNELGMAVDLSHLNEKGFYDAIEISKKPVIVSHSNAYSVCPHKRNLTDAQFEALIKNNGVCGINFCRDFLKNNREIATIDDIISHIEHFCSLGGEQNIGLGSDFDGIDILPEKISSNKDMYLIPETLLKLNYTEEQVKNITFNNFYRTFYEILG